MWGVEMVKNEVRSKREGGGGEDGRVMIRLERRQKG